MLIIPISHQIILAILEVMFILPLHHAALLITALITQLPQPDILIAVQQAHIYRLQVIVPPTAPMALSIEAPLQAMQPVINTPLARAHSAAMFIPPPTAPIPEALFTEVPEPVIQQHASQPIIVLPATLPRILIFTPTIPAAALPALFTQLPAQDIQQNAI